MACCSRPNAQLVASERHTTSSPSPTCACPSWRICRITRSSQLHSNDAGRFHTKRHRANGNDQDNVTDAEVKAFGEYEKALVDKKRAEAELKEAQAGLAAAKKSGNTEAAQSAAERLDTATKAQLRANKASSDALTGWNTEREKGEPNQVRQYRASLLQCACVKQLFDPWLMDADTRDTSEPSPNLQKSENEKLHAHHLHITVDDPRIL